jgi:hypothetical protein
MQKFPQQKTFKNYRELRAKGRAEIQRLLILRALTRKGRKTAAAHSGQGTMANPTLNCFA